MATTAAYIRTQAAVAGLINFVVNPAIDWLSLRHKGAQPIWGADGLVVNFVITSLILSTLVGIFAQWGVRREEGWSRALAERVVVALAAPVAPARLGRRAGARCRRRGGGDRAVLGTARARDDEMVTGRSDGGQGGVLRAARFPGRALGDIASSGVTSLTRCWPAAIGRVPTTSRLRRSCPRLGGRHHRRR